MHTKALLRLFPFIVAAIIVPNVAAPQEVGPNSQTLRADSPEGQLVAFNYTGDGNFLVCGLHVTKLGFESRIEVNHGEAGFFFAVKDLELAKNKIGYAYRANLLDDNTPLTTGEVDFHDVDFSSGRILISIPNLPFSPPNARYKLTLTSPVHGTMELLPPDAPKGLTAVASNDRIVLKWSSSDGGTSYNIFRGSNAEIQGTTAYQTGITATSYTDSGLTNGTVYFYKVAAVNHAGTSAPSEEVKVTYHTASSNSTAVDSRKTSRATARHRSGTGVPGDGICDAAGSGNLAKVKRLLEGNHRLVFSKDKYGQTPLHWAADKGHTDVAKWLLDNKANVNATDNDGYTPLHSAAYFGQTAVAKLLLANKADVNAKDHDGWTPLHDAADNDHKDVAELLLANKADVNARSNSGETPIHEAASAGYKDMVEFLLANKADINAKTNDGTTPLQMAAARRHDGVAELLRQHGGADPSSSKPDAPIDASKTEPVATDAKTSDISIREAAQNGDLAKVTALLNDHPDLVFSKDAFGLTPLHWAAYSGHKDVAELLLANKADVNAKSNSGETPLHQAAAVGYKDMVELLLANKADVNAKTNDGTTPLQMAAARGHDDVVEFLRQHGAHE